MRRCGDRSAANHHPQGAPGPIFWRCEPVGPLRATRRRRRHAARSTGRRLMAVGGLQLRGWTLVRKAGLEPACLSAPPPQDGVSANSTTSALLQLLDTNDLAPCSRKDESHYTRLCTRSGMSLRTDRRNVVVFIVSCPVTSLQREWNRCADRARHWLCTWTKLRHRRQHGDRGQTRKGGYGWAGVAFKPNPRVHRNRADQTFLSRFSVRRLAISSAMASLSACGKAPSATGKRSLSSALM